MGDSREALRARLNGETAKTEWRELERFFARGRVIRISQELDLIEVACRISEDDKAVVSEWMEKSLVAHPSTDEVRDWVEREPLFWTVVTAPWVLVQEVKAEGESSPPQDEEKE